LKIWHRPAEMPHKDGLVSGTDYFPERFHYDRKRWTSWAQKGLLVASDRFGQVVVFDNHGRLVCMFMAFRQRLAGWMPDGTCFGPSIMTGKPNHVEARAKFGQALWNAEQCAAARSLAGKSSR